MGSIIRFPSESGYSMPVKCIFLHLKVKL